MHFPLDMEFSFSFSFMHRLRWLFRNLELFASGRPKIYMVLVHGSNSIL